MKLPILHLADGVHEYTNVIGAGYLQFSGDQVYPNAIDIRVVLNKFEKNITCEIELKTTAHHICDRCLTEYEKNYKEAFKVLFHLGEHDFETEEENVVMLSPEQNEIDLLPFIKENLILSIPMKTVCSSSCKGICSGCGADLNSEACTCSEAPIDPRWEKLRELKK